MTGNARVSFQRAVREFGKLLGSKGRGCFGQRVRAVAQVQFKLFRANACVNGGAFDIGFFHHRHADGDVSGVNTVVGGDGASGVGNGAIKRNEANIGARRGYRIISKCGG